MKDSKTRSKLPRPSKPSGADDTAREGRLVTRMHQPLLDLVDIRARERGESRSRYIERLLVAYLSADPRNPRLDPHGRILTDGPPISKAGDPVRFGAAWSRWVALNENLLGIRVPDGGLDEPPEFVDETRAQMRRDGHR